MSEKPDTAKLVQFGDGTHWTQAEKRATDWRLVVLKAVLWISAGLLVVSGARNAAFAFNFGTTPLEGGFYALVAVLFAALAGLMPVAFNAAGDDDADTIRVAKWVWRASTLVTMAAGLAIALHVQVPSVPSPVVPAQAEPREESPAGRTAGEIYSDMDRIERSRYFARSCQCQEPHSQNQARVCHRYAQLRAELSAAHEAASQSFYRAESFAVAPDRDTPINMLLRCLFAVLSTAGAAVGIDLATRGAQNILTGRTAFQRTIVEETPTEEKEPDFFEFFCRQLDWRPGYEVTGEDLYKYYAWLCEINARTPLSAVQFGKAMTMEVKARGGSSRHSGGTVYVGVRLKPEDREPPRWAPSK